MGISSTRTSWLFRRQTPDLACLGLVVVAGAAGVTLAQLAQRLIMDVSLVAFLTSAIWCVVAAVAWHSTRVARAHSAGIEARVWRLISWGLASWALGCVPYGLFLALGGQVADPAAWSQAGFLLAYPFWYRAFWLLRQPPVAETPMRRLADWFFELTALALVSVTMFGILWFWPLPFDKNVALLLPAALDLLLCASLYNAVRRSAITHGTAYVWFAYAFVALGLTDAMVSYFVCHGPVWALGAANVGYGVAMGFMAVAARRPLRVVEAQVRLGRSRAVIASLGLAVAGPAAAFGPSSLRPAIWVAAGLLLWRLWSLLRMDGGSDTDALSGFLERRALLRHLAGVLQLASPEQPALLIAVELDGFGAWNAQHGVSAGDAILAEVAGSLEASEPSGGVWSRVGRDRFAWVGMGGDAEENRRLGRAALDAAGRNGAGLPGRAGLVLLPQDAQTPATALAAGDEALAAARVAGRPLLAFDRGSLEGVDFEAGYAATLRDRRERVQKMITSPELIRPAFQPIVSVEELRIVGHEALARFQSEPRRTPDKWIAEAQAVGLGLEIEAECVRRAIRERDGAPEGSYLSVNASAQLIVSSALDEALGAGSLEWLVIEITEHDRVSDYAELAARLAALRGRGARVAIDDTGAGHSSLRHVMQLRPDYVKLDRSLIQGLNSDPAKRALVSSMVALVRELGSSLVAEGVETAEELAALRELEVRYAQGYLLARPDHQFRASIAPLPEAAPAAALATA
jgi:EAL domain-containing protein (putative c-di-GMP-specific phosphodiesterase class I)/GGDEF domain-containing protein